MSTQNKFLDVDGRKIQTSERGAYFVRKGGKKVYGIKAVFKNVAGKPVRITSVTAKNVPCTIRPSMVRSKPLTKAAVANFMKGMTTTSANIKKLRRLNMN